MQLSDLLQLIDDRIAFNESKAKRAKEPDKSKIDGALAELRELRHLAEMRFFGT